MKREEYIYNNLSIPGGGYITGFLYHPKYEKILYARTDIGGCYRFDFDKERWVSLVDHVSMEDVSETFPISMALDDNYPQRIYIACGVHASESGVLAISEDYGDSFTYSRIPTMVHGNLNGRGTDERLLIDKNNSNILYFASQTGGLYKSVDHGNSFVKLESMPEDYLTFIHQSDDGKIIIVGSAGVTTKRSERLRGHGLYISYDGGESFQVMWHPTDGEVDGIKLAGLVPQRITTDNEYIYISFSVMGYNAYALENGYSCDGGSVVGGRVVRYRAQALLDARGDIEELQKIGEDITPSFDNKYIDENGLLSCGFSGLDIKGDVLAVSTLSKEDGDCIFRSFDKGNTWECILYGLEIGKMDFRTSYLRPEYNGGKNLIHWLSCLAINPYNHDEMWFNTGTGAFRTRNLKGDVVVFSDWSDGIEETVHLNVYSPVAGDVKVIDILGDLGGFAFTQFEKPCDNSFADSDGNRYITCINADCSDANPNLVIVTPRGNWTGKTKGGLIISEDQCKTFRRLPMPFGLSRVIDDALIQIEQPNVNSGWVAMSPDGQHIVWSIAYGCSLPVDRVIVSHDGGRSFKRVNIIDFENNASLDHFDAINSNINMKVFSDRICNNLFYGFGENSRIYVSSDYGATFFEIEKPSGFPKIDFSKIDAANKTEIRAESGKMGVFYMALGNEGLWKMYVDAHQKKAVARKLSRNGDAVFRMGLGKKSHDSDYITDNKCIYASAIIDGHYGFYRMDEDGKDVVLISNEKQNFGDINSVEGDSQVYGRFYIGSATRGLLYGKPKVED